MNSQAESLQSTNFPRYRSVLMARLRDASVNGWMLPIEQLAQLVRGDPYIHDIVDPVQCEALLEYFEGLWPHNEYMPGVLTHLDNPRSIAEACNVPYPPGFTPQEVAAEIARRDALREPCRCCGDMVSPYDDWFRKSGLCALDCI